jgi:transposase
MGNPKGVRRDFTALEERRLRAARLLEKGVSQSQVARQVGVHRQSLSRWAQQLEKEGRTGLEQAGRAGRKPRLSAEDLQRIERALKRGPEAFGYESGLWTSARVADLIEQELSQKPHRCRTWAPRGQTPVLQYHFNWNTLSIENKVENEQGEKVKLKQGAHVDVIVEAGDKDTVTRNE